MSNAIIPLPIHTPAELAAGLELGTIDVANTVALEGALATEGMERSDLYSLAQDPSQQVVITKILWRMGNVRLFSPQKNWPVSLEGTLFIPPPASATSAQVDAGLQSIATLPKIKDNQGPKVEAASDPSSSFELYDNCTAAHYLILQQELEGTTLPSQRKPILQALVHALRCDRLERGQWPPATTIREMKRIHVANIQALLLRYGKEAAQYLRGVFRDDSSPERQRHAMRILAAIGADALEPLFHAYGKAEQEERKHLTSALLKVTQRLFRRSPNSIHPIPLPRDIWSDFFWKHPKELIKPAAQFLARAIEPESWITALFGGLHPAQKFLIAKEIFAIDPSNDAIRPLLQDPFSHSTSDLVEEWFKSSDPRRYYLNSLVEFLLEQRIANPNRAVLGDYETARLRLRILSAMQEISPHGGKEGVKY